MIIYQISLSKTKKNVYHQQINTTGSIQAGSGTIERQKKKKVLKFQISLHSFITYNISKSKFFKLIFELY